MATVSNLVDLICADTGLGSASGSAERNIVLARLNHAYRQIVQRMGGIPWDGTIAFADGVNTYDLSGHATLGPRFISINQVRDSDGVRLRRRTRDYCSLRAGATGTTSGGIGSWAIEYPTMYVDADAASTTLTLDARIGPLELEEDAGGSGETSPSSLPAVWHEQLLATLTTILVLERYEGREQEAALHRAAYQEAWQEFLLQKSREGGVNAQSDQIHVDRFITPNRARIR